MWLPSCPPFAGSLLYSGASEPWIDSVGRAREEEGRAGRRGRRERQGVFGAVAGTGEFAKEDFS